MSIVNCIHITFIGDKMIMCAMHTYQKEYVLNTLINECNWTPIYNGAMNESDNITHIIRICEGKNNEE